MFTGIIQDLGRIEALSPRGGDVRITIATDRLDTALLKEGDSVAVNGACLTVLDLHTAQFSADVSRETLDVTSLKTAQVGSAVNLETSLKLGDGLDGHLVSGHVDATAAVKSLRNDGRSWRVRIELPNAIAGFVAAKGSICVDGVSLTVNDIGPSAAEHNTQGPNDRAQNDAQLADFGVNIIPHTFSNTLFQHYSSGTLVNLEVDLIARYTARLLGHSMD